MAVEGVPLTADVLAAQDCVVIVTAHSQYDFGWLVQHAKALIVDHDKVFIGSANMDPRSLRINTEMGLLVESRELNARLRAAVERDFADNNAWRLQFDDAGRVNWVSGDEVLTVQPAASTLQRIEDWFFAHLPIEDEL